MLNLKIKSIERNKKGNFHIIGDSNLLDEKGNKIGIVKIDIPNGTFDKDNGIIAFPSNKNK